VRSLSDWATAGAWPDLVVLLDVPEAEADRRLGPARDRMEAEPAAFHAAVLEGFRIQAAEEPDRWVVIDGTPSVEVVAAAVSAVVGERLQLPL
jgi:dTMP kinase